MRQATPLRHMSTRRPGAAAAHSPGPLTSDDHQIQPGMTRVEGSGSLSGSGLKLAHFSLERSYRAELLFEVRLYIRIRPCVVKLQSRA